MSVNPQWTVVFDNNHNLGSYWKTLFNSGSYSNAAWRASNNGTTTALRIVINLPPNTEITSVVPQGFYSSGDSQISPVLFYDGYNGTGNILASNLVSSHDNNPTTLQWNGDIKNAKSLVFDITNSDNRTAIQVITVKGIGVIDPFEQPFIPPDTTVPPPSTNGENPLTAILGILNAANQAVIDKFTDADPDLGTLLKNIENTIGQNPAEILGLFGINLGQYGAALDAAFRDLIASYTSFIAQGENREDSLKDAINSFLNEYSTLYIDAYKKANADLIAQIGDLGRSGGPSDLPDHQQLINDWINSLPGILEPIGTFLFGLWDVFFNASKRTANPSDQYLHDRVSAIGDIIGNLDDGNYNSVKDLVKDLFNVDVNQQGITRVLSFLQLVPLFLEIVKHIYEPTQEIVQQLAYADISPKVLPISEAITAYLRGQFTYPQLIGEISKQGYSEERILKLLNNNVVEPNLAELEEAYLRGYVSEQQHDKYLTHQGYDNEGIKLLKQLYHYYPGLSDLINMAQKGLFNPSIGSAFNQDTAFPQTASLYLANLGISDDWQHKLWAAHWQLPSFGEVIEMYHRGLIDDKALQEYTQISPILPYFRDKLIGLSHKVLSRLDIRKLVKTGQLTYDEVVRAYISQGYASDIANKLANYTIKFDEQGDTDDITVLNKRLIGSVETQYLHNKITSIDAYNALLSYGVDQQHATKILQAIDVERNITENSSKTKDYIDRAIALIQHTYSTGAMPHTDAYNELIRLGLTASEANLELNVLDIERDINQKKEIATVLSDQLAHGRITIGDFNAILSEYGFNEQERNYLAIEAGIKSQHKTKHPTETQLLKWYSQKIITHSELMDELVNLGYTDKYIMWIMDAEDKKQQ